MAKKVCIALVASLLWGVLLWIWRRPDLISWLYFTTIGAPFVLFCFERWHKPSNRQQWMLDTFIVGLSLARIVWAIPFLSGHALFLCYAIGTTHTKASKITTLLVFAQVLWLKLWLVHDYHVFGGIALGVISGIMYNHIGSAISSE